jgi:hypothetical protein
VINLVRRAVMNLSAHEASLTTKAEKEDWAAQRYNYMRVHSSELMPQYIESLTHFSWTPIYLGAPVRNGVFSRRLATPMTRSENWSFLGWSFLQVVHVSFLLTYIVNL